MRPNQRQTTTVPVSIECGAKKHVLAHRNATSRVPTDRSTRAADPPGPTLPLLTFPVHAQACTHESLTQSPSMLRAGDQLSCPHIPPTLSRRSVQSADNRCACSATRLFSRQLVLICWSHTSTWAALLLGSGWSLRQRAQE